MKTGSYISPISLNVTGLNAPSNIYSAFHPNTVDFTLFSSAHGTFSRIDHILSHKSNLNKLKKTEIIPSFSNHNAMRLQISTTRKKKKLTHKHMNIKQHISK